VVEAGAAAAGAAAAGVGGVVACFTDWGIAFQTLLEVAGA